jgi:hypothetical protein
MCQQVFIPSMLNKKHTPYVFKLLPLGQQL